MRLHQAKHPADREEEKSDNRKRMRSKQAGDPVYKVKELEGNRTRNAEHRAKHPANREKEKKRDRTSKAKKREG